MIKLHIKYGGRHHEVQAEPEWTLGLLLADLLKEWTTVDPRTVKLLKPRSGTAPIQPHTSPQQPLAEAGAQIGRGQFTAGGRRTQF